MIQLYGYPDASSICLESLEKQPAAGSITKTQWKSISVTLRNSNIKKRSTAVK